MTAPCVLFDLDNTLTDRRQSIINFARRFQQEFTDDLNKISFAQLEAAMQHGDNLGYKPKSQMFEDLVRGLPWQKPPTVETVRDFWYAESPASMQSRIGMIETLTALRETGYQLGMISNGRTAVQNTTIDAIGVRKYMELIVISEAAGIRKPDAGIFQIAFRQLEVNPKMTWYIGDHPHSDMQGAANAGIKGVWVRSGGHTWPEDQPPPQYQIDELPELLHLLAD